MAIPKKLVKFLEAKKVKYESIKHRIVYTAYDKAQTLRVPQKIVGKTLVVKFDKDFALVLIPANKNLDKGKLKKVAKVKKVDFVKESWMKKNLRGIKIGAVPPFGNLWTPTLPPPSRKRAPLPTFVDRGVVKNQKIIINSGDYNWSIKISSASLKKLLPDLVVGNFSQSKK